MEVRAVTDENDDYIPDEFDEILYDMIDEAMNPSVDDSASIKTFLSESAKRLRVLYDQTKSCQRCQMTLFDGPTRRMA